MMTMLKIWFMFDDHTFAKVTDLTPDALFQRAKELFEEDGCGGLYVHDESGTTINSLTFHGRQLHNGQYGAYEDDLRRWANKINEELSFRKLMA